MAKYDANKVAMLKQILGYYGLMRNSDVAKFFGISEQLAFARLKNGYIDFEEIYRLCPEISPDWLLSGGEGPMLREERDNNIASMSANIEGNPNQSASVVDGENLRSALEALKMEQEVHAHTQDALAKAQEQIGDLISILKTK